MTEYAKPLPMPTPWSKPFWDGCKQHKLLIQRCRACGTLLMYPKLFCANCLSDDLEWIRASGRGKIYTYATIHGYQPSEFAGDVPYTVAVIRLDEGVQMMSNIVECALDEIRCDLPVEVVFDDVTEEVTLPKFRPVR